MNLFHLFLYTEFVNPPTTSLRRRGREGGRERGTEEEKEGGREEGKEERKEGGREGKRKRERGRKEYHGNPSIKIPNKENTAQTM